MVLVLLVDLVVFPVSSVMFKEDQSHCLSHDIAFQIFRTLMYPCQSLTFGGYFKSSLSVFFTLEALQFPRYQDIFEEAVCAHSFANQFLEWSYTAWLNKLNDM